MSQVDCLRKFTLVTNSAAIQDALSLSPYIFGARLPRCLVHLAFRRIAPRSQPSARIGGACATQWIASARELSDSGAAVGHDAATALGFLGAPLLVWRGAIPNLAIFAD